MAPSSTPSSAPSAAPSTVLNERQPPTGVSAWKTKYDQTFLGDSAKCAEYAFHIAAANAEATGVDQFKITVTAGAGCTGSRRRMATQDDSLTFHVEIAQIVQIDVAEVQALVEQSLATSQPSLVLVSMTEPTYEEDTDSEASADEGLLSSLTSSWVTIGLSVCCAWCCLACLAFCAGSCCEVTKCDREKGTPIPPGLARLSPPLFSTPDLQKMWDGDLADVELQVGVHIPVVHSEKAVTTNTTVVQVDL